MASSYKYLDSNDRIVSTTNLTEVVSGSAATAFVSQSYTDYTNFKSASVTFFDITFGRSSVTSGATSSYDARQKAIYNQFAKNLIGYESDNSILKFSLDANNSNTDNILHNAFFINFPRSLVKDKIKKGTFSLTFSGSSASKSFILADKSGTLGPTYRECETGEFGLLYVVGNSETGLNPQGTNLTGGLVFYEAGVALISPYIYSEYSASNPIPSSSATNFALDANPLGIWTSIGSVGPLSGSRKIEDLILTSSVSQIAEGLGNAIRTASFQAISELNSTVYFCRAFNNEFNYSSNPTYLSESAIVVKDSDPLNQPVAYITTVGLYSDDNQLLAVAKLSEPIKKTPETELITRVRLDF